MSVSIGDICITHSDYEKLARLLDGVSGLSSAFNVFAKGLKKAKKVDPRKIPPDYITMNSTFRLTDLGTGESKTYTLVYPDDEDVKKGKLSILSPEGLSTLGYKVGNVIRWKEPKGEKYLQISKILSHPDSAHPARV